MESYDFSQFDTKTLKYLFTGFAILAQTTQVTHIYWTQEMRDELRALMDQCSDVLGFKNPQAESPEEAAAANKTDAEGIYALQRSILQEIAKRSVH